MLPIKEYLKNPRTTAVVLLEHFGQWLPESVYLRIMFRLRIGHKLHLRNPKTFNEKMQWLKLYNRRPEYTMMVDKYAVKEYVAGIIGDEYIIPTLGVWEKPEDIDFDSLPNQFVLKTTHGGGSVGVVICKDKSSFDCQKAISRLKYSMKQDVYKYQKEWPYKNVKKRIIAEQYIEPRPNVKDLPDYKWFCFNGEPKYCQVIQDRNAIETIDFFDTEWVHQDFCGLNPVFGPQVGTAMVRPECPQNLLTHIKIAQELSKGLPFSRIDLYETGEKTYFGELTFFPESGMGVYTPDNYNEILGKLLVLPGEKRGGVIINVLDNGELVFRNPDLNDYKFYCFNSVPQFMLLISERDLAVDARCDYYDMDFVHLPFSWAYPTSKYPASTPPLGFEKMKDLASKISKGLPHARIDLYNIAGKIYFGEITMYHGGGFCKFDPIEWDYKYGELIDLPPKCNN